MTYKERIKKEYGKDSAKLIDKECSSIDELKTKLADGLILSYSKNSIISYKKGITKIIIVGTMIPDGLLYFYFGEHSNIYLWIDEARKTSFNNAKERIRLLKKAGHEQKAEKELNSFIKNLEKEGIAFVDTFDSAVHKEGSSRDKDICCYTINRVFFESLKVDQNIKIIAVSKLAQCILLEKLGFTNVEHIKLFFNAKKEPFIKCFKEAK